LWRTIATAIHVLLDGYTRQEHTFFRRLMMPDYQELKISVTANQDAELRNVIGALVQELDDDYILVHLADDELGVLHASHLAWLPYGKTLADLEQHFLPTHKLDGAGLTDDEIGDAVDTHSDKVVLLYDGDEFQQLIAAPPVLGPDSIGSCTLVYCQNCGRRVSLCGNRKICPVCSQYAVL
jgi:hypothetical protein